MGIIAIISSIISLFKAIMDLIGFIKTNNLQSWLGELSTNIAAMKVAKTPEEKSNVAKSMADLINRM